MQRFCSVAITAFVISFFSSPLYAMETLKIGMPGKDIKIACIIVAQYLGYYEDEGVEVQFEGISNLSEGLTAVDMRKLDVLPFGVIPSASFVGQGADVVVIGGTITEGSEIVVRPENADSIRSIEDFRGKKIGCYRMETGHMLMKGLLRGHGFDLEKDVRFVLLDSQPTIIQAVLKGEVDLGFLNSGQGYVAKQSGLVVAKRVGEFNPLFPCCRQTTARATLESKRDALLRYQIANLRGLHTFMTDKASSISVLAKHAGQPEEFVEAIMYGKDDPKDPYTAAMIVSLDPNREKVLDFYDVMRANGDIDPATKHRMEDHIDTSLYEDALAEMMRREPENPFYANLMAEFRESNHADH